MEQLRIDLVPMGVTPNAHASQYDVGRVIRFLLYNGGSAYTLAGTETITVKMAKPDGTEETVSVTNTSSNYVDFVTTDGLLNQAGLYPCEISITSGTDVIGSKNFNLRVELDPYDGHNIRTVTVGPADICTFETNLPEPYPSVTVNVLATGGNGTPDNPIPINGYSSANITRCGVNILGGENFADIIVDKVPNAVKDTINKTITYEAPYVRNIILFDKFKLNTQYTFFIKRVSGVSNLRINYTDGTSVSIYTYPQTSANDKSILNLSGEWNSGTSVVSYDECGVFEGVKTVADFVPYNGQTYTIAFGQTVYGGVLDVTRGKLSVTHAKYTGTWSDGVSEYLPPQAPSVKRRTFTLNPQAPTSSVPNNGHSLCNVTDTYSTLNTLDSSHYYLSDNLYLYLPIATSDDTVIECAYVIKEPFDIDLTSVQIRALVGENNVYADCGETEVEYLTEGT